MGSFPFTFILQDSHFNLIYLLSQPVETTGPHGTFKLSRCRLFIYLHARLAKLHPHLQDVSLRRQEGDRPTAGAGAGGSDQAPPPVAAPPQQREEADGSVQAQAQRLRLGPEELGRGAGAAAEREGLPPAGPAALQEARAHPAAAEGRPGGGRQGHLGLRAAGGD